VGASTRVSEQWEYMQQRYVQQRYMQDQTTLGLNFFPQIQQTSTLWPCLDTPAGLELELVSNSSSSPKLTLALEVFG
jgi:hypothetical protein